MARDVRARVDKLELPFSKHGIDPYGIDRAELAKLLTVLRFLYHRYFKVEVYGVEHIPPRGRCMLVGNHSGGVAIDAMMVVASVFFEMDPPRLAQGMADRFLKRIPGLGWMTDRLGTMTGLPQHSIRLLEEERLLLVFPEGVRGTAKLFPYRDWLVEFGTGFARIALQTKTPVVPFAFVGGGEAIPTIANLYGLGRRLGFPYIPVTPYGLAFPLPVTLQILYGQPIILEGNANDNDDIIAVQVQRVKDAIADLLQQGRALRERRLSEGELRL